MPAPLWVLRLALVVGARHFFLLSEKSMLTKYTVSLF